MSFLPRACYMSPSHPDGGRNLPTNLAHKVTFRHPGYNDGNNIILVLPALDHLEGGIHYETARIACAICANNQWDGYFTETRTGPQVEIEIDGILRGKEYYFR